MIPIYQTKVNIKNSNGEVVQHGNCFAAAVASILEVPITEVPNVEVLINVTNGYWWLVMDTWLQSKGYELCADDRYKVFHDDKHGLFEGKREEWIAECINKYYIVVGKSHRGVMHNVIYKNGEMVHDPHLSQDGLLTFERFESIEPTPPSQSSPQ
jgi:hypothetical protein